MRIYILLGILLTTTLGACVIISSVPKYELPSGAMHVNLKNEISGKLLGRYQSINIYASGSFCSPSPKRTIFTIYSGMDMPSETRQIVASVPIMLSYHEEIPGGRYCDISVEAVLDPEGDYSVIGGASVKGGAIPILMDTRMCQFAVKDNRTGNIVSYPPTCD